MKCSLLSLIIISFCLLASNELSVRPSTVTDEFLYTEKGRFLSRFYTVERSESKDCVAYRRTHEYTKLGCIRLGNLFADDGKKMISCIKTVSTGRILAFFTTINHPLSRCFKESFHLHYLEGEEEKEKLYMLFEDLLERLRNPSIDRNHS
jgi:hypothetical protein